MRHYWRCKKNQYYLLCFFNLLCPSTQWCAGKLLTMVICTLTHSQVYCKFDKLWVAHNLQIIIKCAILFIANSIQPLDFTQCFHWFFLNLIFYSSTMHLTFINQYFNVSSFIDRWTLIPMANLRLHMVN